VTGLRCHSCNSCSTWARVLMLGIAWGVPPASPVEGVNPEVAIAGRDTAATSAIRLKRDFMSNSWWLAGSLRELTRRLRCFFAP
jgi:hypothetical protein